MNDELTSIIVDGQVAQEMYRCGMLSRSPKLRHDGTALVAVPASDRKKLDAYVVAEGIDYTEAMRRFIQRAEVKA